MKVLQILKNLKILVHLKRFFQIFTVYRKIRKKDICMFRYSEAGRQIRNMRFWLETRSSFFRMAELLTSCIAVKMNTALPIRWSRKGTLPQRCIPARRRPGTGQAFIHGWTLNNLSIWKTGEEDRNITDIMQAILLHIGKYEICTEVKKRKTSLSFAWRSRIMAVIVILPELKILPRT